MILGTGGVDNGSYDCVSALLGRFLSSVPNKCYVLRKCGKGVVGFND